MVVRWSVIDERAQRGGGRIGANKDDSKKAGIPLFF
jgi:hypothetical protein